MHRSACLVSLLPLVAAHGFLSSPPGRRPGDSYRATCGDQPFNQQSSDINGNIQGIQQVVGNDVTEDCNLWLCKGFLLEDNPDQVQSYSLGQTIDITVNIAAPHTGYANVSVVKTSTNTMIGNPLIEFQNYASNAGMDANNTAFSVTMPETLGGDCTTAGDCVLQWFWDAPDIDQTYAACADFVVAGGSGTSPSDAPVTSTAAATTTSAVTATSVDTAPATTSTAVPDNSGDDECPVDGGDEEEEEEDQDQGEGDDNGDAECPAEDGEEEEEDTEEGDDTEEAECPVDDGEGGDDVATTTTALGAKDVSTSAAATATGSGTNTVTQIITSTVTTERVVTVTAAATACN
ncbi:uncharacterized protein B0H64DRAFT_362640 [Chaetomium fimeti]|uniref:Chitin-binding type-4 domain-containing protein n=1 Tax=Chaetomium fimeti TaxID=1854472 RepID=A0AAE0HE76_9PEZI|nr:hypothetical protein B0H64DRAFT_362640 [Chaetomium fimeti]